MRFTHVLLDVYCLYGLGESENIEESPIPNFCINEAKKPGFHCMEHYCKNVGFAPA